MGTFLNCCWCNDMTYMHLTLLPWHHSHCWSHCYLKQTWRVQKHRTAKNLSTHLTVSHTDRIWKLLGIWLHYCLLLLMPVSVRLCSRPSFRSCGLSFLLCGLVSFSTSCYKHCLFTDVTVSLFKHLVCCSCILQLSKLTAAVVLHLWQIVLIVWVSSEPHTPVNMFWL